MGPTRTAEDVGGHRGRTIALILQPRGFLGSIVSTRINPPPWSAWSRNSVAGAEDVGVNGKIWPCRVHAHTRRILTRSDASPPVCVYPQAYVLAESGGNLDSYSPLERRPLKRASFTSVDELRRRIFALLDSFNKPMAKPFKWPSAGRPLVCLPWQHNPEEHWRQAVLVQLLGEPSTLFLAFGGLDNWVKYPQSWTSEASPPLLQILFRPAQCRNH